MAWFKRQAKPAAEAAEAGRASGASDRGPLAEMRRLPPDHLEEGPGGQPATSAPSAAATPASTPPTRLKLLFDGELAGARRRPALHRPARVRGQQALPRAPGGHAAGHQPERRADLGRRQRWTAARCRSAPWSRASSAAAWAAVVGEKITRAIERAIERRDAAGDRFRLRRRAHAGRRRQPDADGQDLGRADAPGRGASCPTSACSPTPPPAA